MAKSKGTYTILTAKRRKDVVGRDKPVWQDVGFTLFVRSDQSVTLIDERTGNEYPCYPVRPYSERENSAPAPAKEKKAKPEPADPKPYEDDIPF